MKCKYCGTLIEDGSTVCSQCGAAVEQEVICTDPAPSCDAPENVCCDNGCSFEMPVQKKSKKPLIIAAIAAVLVIAIALVFLLTPLVYWIKRAVTPADKLMVNAYIDGIHLLFDAGESMEKLTGVPAEKPQGAEGQLKLQLSEQLLNQMGAEVDMSWLSDVALDYDVSMKDNVGQAVLGLSLGENSLLSASVISDSEKLWIKVPEIHEQALVTELVQDDALPVPAIQRMTVSDEVAENLLVRYMEAFLKGFTNVEKTTEVVTVGEITQKLTLLKASINAEQLSKTVIGIIEMAKEDQELKQILTDAGVYEDFISGADESLKEINDSMAECDPDDVIYLHTYLNSRNMLSGFTLTAKDTTDEYAVLFLTEKNQFAADIRFVDAMHIVGSGTLGDHSVSSWQMEVDGEKVLNLDVDVTVDKSGSTSGTMTYAAYIDGEKLGVKLDFSATAEGGEYTANITSGSESIATLSFTLVATEADEITIPENAVDMNDDEAMLTWASSLDLSKVIEALTEAGFPLELLFSAMYG